MTTPNAAARAASPPDTTAQGLSPAAARAALVRLCAASFAFASCSYSICRAPLLPLFARELGAGPSLVGFVMGASTLTGVFLKLPAGALSNLFGRRRLLLMGALVFATLPFTYLAVSTLTAVVFVRSSSTAARRQSLVRWPPQACRTSHPPRRERWLQHLFDRTGDRPGHRPNPGRIC